MDGTASEDESDDETTSQHRAQGNQGADSDDGENVDGDNNDDMEEDGAATSNGNRGARNGNQSTSNERRAENQAAIEGVSSEVRVFLDAEGRSDMIWRNDIDRYVQTDIPDEWKTWGRVPDSFDGHLKLRSKWLSWMACTSKLLQTVDNKHMNRHQDYMYSGPTINFVDLQSTPQIGRRLEIAAHLVECINNFSEFPLDCVVPTPETEIVMGSGRGGGKLVRGMRMKNPDKTLAREAELVSTEDTHGAEKWLKNFNRGIATEEDVPAGETMGDEAGGGNSDDNTNGMVETQIVRLVVRVFPVVHKNFKGIGRVISIIGLPGVNVAKCLQRVCDPRFYDQKHSEIGRSREALWREIVHMEFGVLEQQMRHDDMEGRLCDFENYHDYKYHVFHFCSEVKSKPNNLKPKQSNTQAI